MPLISPLLWQGLPFKHADGEMDFLGMHDELTRRLGIEHSPDFSLYDLEQRQGWVLFMQAHSIEHERLRAATGL